MTDKSSICGAWVTSGTTPLLDAVSSVTTLAAERRQLTVVFCDLVDSTPLASQLDPEDLGGILRAYQNQVAAVVGRYDGFVAAHLGDGALIHFGYPNAHEDDAERAVLCGLAIVEAVRRLASPAALPLTVRVGIATGLVMVGDIVGTGTARAGDVVGETPNLAARLQAAAMPGTVVMSLATRRLVGGLFECRDLGVVTAKGFATPQPAWQVLRAVSTGSRFEGTRGVVTGPLVGRQAEFDVLSRCWQRTVQGEGGVVLLSGEPGIGKSRLVLALQDRLEGQHAFLRYDCSPLHANSAFYPVIRHLAQAACIEPACPHEAVRNSLAALFAPAVPTALDLALVADLLSVSGAAADPLPGLSPERRRELVLDLLTRQVAGLARHRPLLMIVEDLQWIDPTSRFLLDRVVAAAPDLPILVVITQRSDVPLPWPDNTGIERIPLAHLGPAETAALAVNTAGPAALPAAALDAIVSRSDGIPLFAEELTRATLAASSANIPAGSRTPARSAVPESLYASLMSQLDRLGPVAKQVAQAGAVIGRDFSDEMLRSLTECDDVERRLAVEQLLDARLLLECRLGLARGFTFRHRLLRDAAYDTLLRSRRKALHGRFLHTLEGHFAAVVEHEPEVLAQHAALAGLTLPAVRYWLRAGERAVRGHALVEAEAHLTAGLELLVEVAEGADRRTLECGLQAALGQALMGVRGYADPATGRAFARVRALSADLCDGAALFPALHGQFVFHHVGGRLGLALEIAEQFLQLAMSNESQHLVFFGHFLAGMPNFHMGKFAAALEHWQAALAAYDPAGRQYIGLSPISDFRGLLSAYRSWALLAIGDIEAAVKADEDAMGRVDLARADSASAGTLCISASFSYLRGDFASAQTKLKPTLALCAEQKYSLWLAVATMVHGWAVAEGGQAMAGLETLRRGIHEYTATGSSLMTAAGLRALADLLWKQGEGVEAMAVVDEALELLQGNQDRWVEAELQRIRGEAAQVLGDPAMAEASFRAAMSVAEAQGAAFWALRAATSLAHLLAEQSRFDEAHDVLSAAHRKMPSGFAMPDLRDVEALIGTLGLKAGDMKLQPSSGLVPGLSRNEVSDEWGVQGIAAFTRSPF